MSIKVNDLSAIKSTIDFWGTTLAVGILSASQVLDLDDRVNIEDKLLSDDDNYLVWQVMDFQEGPRRGIYNVAFLMGIAQQRGNSNMEVMSLTGEIANQFCVGSTYDVKDYTKEEPPTEVFGRLALTTKDMNPQVSDGLTGYRLILLGGLYYAN